MANTDLNESIKIYCTSQLKRQIKNIAALENKSISSYITNLIDQHFQQSTCIDSDIYSSLNQNLDRLEVLTLSLFKGLYELYSAEDKFEKIDSASTVLDVINEENKVEFEDFSIIHLECLFDVLDNCLLVNYRYKYTGEDSDDFTYSNTIRLLKDNNVEDIIDYYPIFKLAVFAGLNNAKHEYQDAQQYYCEKDAIKEELNKSFLITYAHIQVFKELNK